MQQQTTSFDFIDTAARAYSFAWDKRQTLFYLAIWPIALKFFSLLLVYYLDLQDAFLRQGLILLPAYFAEGWLAAQAVRLLIISDEGVLGHQGPKIKFSKNSFEQNRRELLASVILYVLVIVISTGAIGGILDTNLTPEQIESGQPGPNAMVSLLGMMALAFSVWAFRFIWLYAVVGLGYSIRDYVQRVPSIMTSFQMLGAWLVCIVPIGLVVMIASQVMLSALGGTTEEPGTVYSIAILALSAVYEGALAIVATTAMAVAITHIMEGTPEQSQP